MICYVKTSLGKVPVKKRCFEVQAGAHLRVYIAGKITGDENYRQKFAKAEEVLHQMGHSVRPCCRRAWNRETICASAFP